MVVNNAELIPVHHHASDGNAPSADKPSGAPNPNNKSHKHMPMEENEFTTGKMYARLKQLAAYIQWLPSASFSGLYTLWKRPTALQGEWKAIIRDPGHSKETY